jgi:hypothetical protein
MHGPSPLSQPAGPRASGRQGPSPIGETPGLPPIIPIVIKYEVVRELVRVLHREERKLDRKLNRLYGFLLGDELRCISRKLKIWST